MAYRVESRKRNPNFHSPTARIGILISRIPVPVGRPLRRFKIMAIPVTPPGARLFGSRNRLTPIPYMTVPTVISR